MHWSYRLDAFCLMVFAVWRVAIEIELTGLGVRPSVDLFNVCLLKKNVYTHTLSGGTRIKASMLLRQSGVGGIYRVEFTVCCGNSFHPVGVIQKSFTLGLFPAAYYLSSDRSAGMLHLRISRSCYHDCFFPMTRYRGVVGPIDENALVVAMSDGVRQVSASGAF